MHSVLSIKRAIFFKLAHFLFRAGSLKAGPTAETGLPLAGTIRQSPHLQRLAIDAGNVQPITRSAEEGEGFEG